VSLETRTLGQQGLVVAAIGLGCTGMSQSYGPASVLDTAEAYSNHANEELLGRALKGRRDARHQVGLQYGHNGQRLAA
jgi:aryl-alcohol dehydrogenase-like predicted oxidoreductase